MIINVLLIIFDVINVVGGLIDIVDWCNVVLIYNGCEECIFL